MITSLATIIAICRYSCDDYDYLQEHCESCSYRPVSTLGLVTKAQGTKKWRGLPEAEQDQHRLEAGLEPYK